MKIEDLPTSPGKPELVVNRRTPYRFLFARVVAGASWWHGEVGQGGCAELSAAAAFAPGFGEAGPPSPWPSAWQACLWPSSRRRKRRCGARSGRRSGVVRGGSTSGKAGGAAFAPGFEVPGLWQRGFASFAMDEPHLPAATAVSRCGGVGRAGRPAHRKKARFYAYRGGRTRRKICPEGGYGGDFFSVRRRRALGRCARFFALPRFDKSGRLHFACICGAVW